MRVTLSMPMIQRWISSRPFLFAVFAFVVSYFILPFYSAGDQTSLRHVYDMLPNLGFLEGFFYYNVALDAQEPGYFLLVYVFSGFMDKDLLMSLLNAVLCYYLGLWLIRKNIPWRIIALLSLNFYLLVLFFSAERLKLGLLFVLMASAYSGAYRHIYLCFAIFSHVQIALLLVSKLSSNIAISVLPLFRGRLRLKLLFSLVGALFVVGLLFTLREHILSKMEVYMALSGGVTHLVKPLIFTVFTLYYARHRWFEAFSMHAPIMLAAFIVGGERIVVFSYFVFMLYGLQFRRGSNFGVYLFSTYFFVKGIIFITNIITYGNGFLAK